MDIVDIIALFFLGVFLYGVFYVTWEKKRSRYYGKSDR